MRRRSGRSRRRSLPLPGRRSTRAVRRDGEALALRWKDLAPDFSRATLPDSKTGRSHRDLGEPAQRLLGTIPRIGGSPFVFPGLSPLRPLSRAAVFVLWCQVRTAADLPDVRLHDLRHSYASVGVSRGYSLPIVAKLLGHSSVAMTERYSHLAATPVQLAANDIAAHIERALNREPALQLHA